MSIGHNLPHDEHKTTTAASTIPASEISWTRTLPARWRISKNICLLLTRHERRRPGCHRSSCLSYIRLLGDDETAFNPAHVDSLAQDRSG